MELTYEQLKEQYAEARARLTVAESEIQSLEARYQPQAMMEYFTPFIIALAIVGLFCWSSVRKAKIKYFGSCEQYKAFVDWQKNHK